MRGIGSSRAIWSFITFLPPHLDQNICLCMNNDWKGDSGHFKIIETGNNLVG